MGQRIMRNDARQVVILGRLGPHKFAARRRVVKKVANRDRGARIARGILHVDEPSALDNYTGGRLFPRPFW